MKRFLLLSIAALLFAAAYLGTDLKSVPTSAFATGGGYTATKHGGGTTDGVAPCSGGVNRSRQANTTDYPGGANCTSPNNYYGSAQAGTYASGECAHCHEPHASFGTTGAALNEPPPIGADLGPDSYLLMKEYETATPYTNLCLYCHDNINNSLTATVGYGYWGFFRGGNLATPTWNYTGSVGVSGSSHYINADAGTAMAWPGTTGDTPADNPLAWPRQSRATLPAGNNGSCLNCHTPHGVSGTYDTGTAPTNAALNFSVNNNSVSGLIPRQLIAREEALCLRCHDASVASTNIKTQVDKWGWVATTSWTGSTAGSGHPVREASYYGRHNLAKSAPYGDSNAAPPTAAGWFTSTVKHAECVDCHNPHTVQGAGYSAAGGYATPWGGGVFQWSKRSGDTWGDSWNTNRSLDSISGPIRLAAQNRGVWGVTVSSTPNATTGGMDITGTTGSLQSWNDTTPNYVYNLCLKCHSYWAWGAATNAGPTAGNAGWNSPSAAKTWAGATPRGPSTAMTNQAWEFGTNGVVPSNANTVPGANVGRMAYHPVFAKGRNAPESWTKQFAAGTRNPCWCVGKTCPPTLATYAADGAFGACGSAIGTRTDLTAAVPFANANQTLSQNFVPPWNHRSYVTCTDCHEDNSETTPRGPHGSARPFILRGLDTSISYARSGTTAFGYSTLPAGTNMVFCLNCHRADIYGWQGVAAAPGYMYFARQPHYTSFDPTPSRVWAATTTPNGIVCMFCHGAINNALGGIHGNDATSPTTTCTWCNNSGRLIVTTGAAAGSGGWSTFTKGGLNAAGACVTANFGCNGNGAFNRIATYNY